MYLKLLPKGFRANVPVSRRELQAIVNGACR